LTHAYNSDYIRIYRHSVSFQVASVILLLSSGEIARRCSYTTRNMGVAHSSKIKMCLSTFHTEPNTPRSRKGFHGCAQVSFSRMSAVGARNRVCVILCTAAGRVRIIYRVIYTARYADESGAYIIQVPTYIYTGDDCVERIRRTADILLKDRRIWIDEQ